MEKIIIRQAIETDLPTLFEFEQAVVATERPFDSTLKEGVIHYYDLGAMINEVEVKLLVAELNGEIIGSGYARIEDAKDYLKYRRFAYCGFMYVKPGSRRMGVNKLILDGLKAWCQSLNITEMRLEVYAENNAAIKAYEKSGFKSLLTWMRMGLND